MHAEAFDIDWDFGHGKVLIPVLGDDDLRDGGRSGTSTVDDELRYHDHRFPLAPGTLRQPRRGARAQHYELVSWRRGDSELNYRRFFTVTTLAGVRVEVPEVFAATHVEVRRWFDEDLVDGLRIDHPDGLRDPEGYLDHLAEPHRRRATPWSRRSSSPARSCPRGWAMDGTTGYDVLALLDRVLTDPAGEQPLTDLETRLRGRRAGLARGWSTTASARSPTAACWPRPGASSASSPTCCRTSHERARGRGRRGAGLLPGLPLLPARRSRPSRPGARRRAAGATRSRRRPRRPRAGARRPGGARRAALPADQRDGDGQGRRGQRVLPDLAAHLAQRGRRRPRASSRSRPRSSTRRWPPGSATGRTR